MEHITMDVSRGRLSSWEVRRSPWHKWEIRASRLCIRIGFGRNLEIFNNFCVVRKYQLLENENKSLFDSFFNQPPICKITCEETKNHPYLYHEP